jgi:uncharacterized protein (TIGR03067 family)
MELTRMITGIACGLVALLFQSVVVRPSASDLRRAHAMLSGVWQYVSYTENGESLGPQLVRERLAQGGRLTIGERVVRSANPVTGKPEIKGYRINPAATPRQIDFVCEDDSIQRGIYMFENDNLLICYNLREGSNRPDSFEAPARSERVLARLETVGPPGESRAPLDEPPLIRAPGRGFSGAAVAASEGQVAPTREELRRAHGLLTGVWRIESMVDSGELLGSRLIRNSMAADGRVTVSQRAIELLDPETGQTRVLSYRINPAETPRQIDVIGEDNETLRGIYKIEEDELVICLNHVGSGERPGQFDAPRGSGLILMRLSMADSQPKAIPDLTPLPAPDEAGTSIQNGSSAPALDSKDGDDVKFASFTKTSATLPPKPSAAELARAHEILAGRWDFISVVRDGETYNDQLIRRKLAEDGQMVIGDRVFQVTAPGSKERRVSAFKINPAATPSQIDVISHLDSQMQGIYKIEGDELWLCLHRREDGERPVSFEAPAGSGNVLMRLRMAEEEPAPAAVEPGPEPMPPTPEELARQRAERVRQMLVGSWVTSDNRGSLTLVLRPDGTYMATRNWSRAVKRLFAGRQSTTQGRWSYDKGIVRTNVTATNESKLQGRSFASRIQSIGTETAVATDILGQTQTYRRLR